jgi:arsenite transporter
MGRIAQLAERHQVPLYVAAIVVAAAVGSLAPGIAPVLEPAITPVLGLLLFVTFLGVPLLRVLRAFRDARFLATVLVVNFVAAPAVVFALSRFVAHDAALLLGVLLVLLTPCVDYVIAFAGVAGGDRERLLAATPVLMIVQILALPVYLWLFAGADALGVIDPGPFVEAFAVLVVLPLAAAAVVQALAARRLALRRAVPGLQAAMVPLMMATLFVVVASQVAAVGGALTALAGVIPLFLAFAALMAVVGWGAGRLARLDRGRRIAVAFSGVTRNSLVVLPLALALPPPLALVPLVIVTQTLVELLLLVVGVSVVRRLPARS